MLLRFTLSAAGAMVLAGSASAQTAMQAQPITSPVKDAGVYHVATGTWTRGATSVALAGPETIYDNTCTVGFYTGLPGGTIAGDSGRIPSTSSPASTSSLVGLYDNYEVNGFTFAYCTFEPAAGYTMDVAFYDCYAACDNAGAGFPTAATAAFQIVNAPAGGAAGTQGCWILTFDLQNVTGASFDLGGDCNGTYDNVASTDSFGWTWTQSVPTTFSDAGPLLAGDPLGFFPQSGQTCGGIGGGTTFAGASPGPGTGMGTDIDQFEAAGTLSGCFFFGGYSSANPLSSFYMSLRGDDAGPTTVPNGTAYCVGDGSGGACPCGNNSAVGAGEGCANSTGSGATMVASGSASFTNDTLAFTIAGVNGQKPGLILRGNNAINGGLGNGVGDGLICTGGQSGRSQVQVTDVNGDVVFSNYNGSGFGSVANVGAPTFYQYWYRDSNPIGPCATGFNFSNAWDVTYQP